MNAVPRPHPQMDREVRDQIEEHCFSTTVEEVGGFLAGTVGSDATHIVAALPAQGSRSSQVSMTFTHESWGEALATVEREHPGNSIVGWYHSHPGFGLFLSGHDAFIQQNFFPAEGQVALVVDPVEGSSAWFYYDGSEIVELGREATSRAAVSKPSSTSATSSGAAVRWGPAVGLAIAAAVIGLLGGWFLAASQNDRTVQDLANQVKGLQGQIQSPPPSQAPAPGPSSTGGAPQGEPKTQSVVYIVQSGDTLTRIAVAIGGGEDALPAIVRANPGISADELAIGQRIIVPLDGEPG